MNITDTKSMKAHDLDTINKIVEIVLSTLHKEAFGF